MIYSYGYAEGFDNGCYDAEILISNRPYPPKENVLIPKGYFNKLWPWSWYPSNDLIIAVQLLFYIIVLLP